MIVYLLLAVVIYLLLTRRTEKKVEGFEHNKPISSIKKSKKVEVSGYTGDSSELELADYDSAKIELGKCGDAGQFISSNLLPKTDKNMDTAAEFVPTLEGKNFVDSHKFVKGMSSQSLRNANYQLRSDPPNPQEAVCPWMQSTINPEERRRLDIGSV